MHVDCGFRHLLSVQIHLFWGRPWACKLNNTPQIIAKQMNWISMKLKQNNFSQFQPTIVFHCHSISFQLDSGRKFLRKQASREKRHSFTSFSLISFDVHSLATTTTITKSLPAAAREKGMQRVGSINNKNLQTILPKRNKTLSQLEAS